MWELCLETANLIAKNQSFSSILVIEAQRHKVTWPRSAAELVFIESDTVTKTPFLLWTNTDLRVLCELINPHGHLLSMFRVNTQ